MTKVVRNREQEIAFQHKYLSSLTANAGSGKTHVLVDKYLDILENDPLTQKDPSKIIAITFTKKAASELRKKLSKKLESLIENENDAKRRFHLQSIKRDLIQAKISTIHSFCSSIIRDNPIEAGLSPAFVEIDDAEKKDILTNVINDDLKRSFNKKDPLVIELLDQFSLNELRDHINKIISLGDEVFTTLSIFDKSEDELFDKLIGYYKIIVEPVIQIFDRLNNELQDDKFISVYTHIKSFSTITKNDLRSFFDSEKFKFGRSTPHTYLSKLDLISSEEKTLLNNFYDSIKGITSDLDSLMDHKYLQVIKKVILLSQRIYQDFRSEKRELSVVDYDDMLIIANELLDDPDIRQKTISSFSYLMVDEFQDTSGIQYEIVKNLIPNLTSEGETKGLFIVGDAKQSIYAFRNADVRVFLNAIEDIKSTNQKIGVDGLSFDTNEKEKYGEIDLKVSYRMYPNPVLFINHVMKQIMKKDSEYDVEYEDLICGFTENNKHLFERISDNTLLSNEFGSVEFLKPMFDKEIHASASIVESEQIAKRIVKMIDEEDYDPGEIAILFRASTHFKTLTDQLKKYKIPFEAFGSKGYFKNQEINDLVSYLIFLNDPFDDLNFISLLKSYFFNYSDNELLEISNYNGEYFYDRFQDFVENSTRDKDKFTSKTLSSYLKDHSFIKLRDLIVEILDRSLFYKAIERTSNIDQIKANVEKFIDIAGNYEETGLKDLDDLTHYLKEFAFDSDTSNAEIRSSSNKVILSTIHKSKGLEFRAVILFNSGSTSNVPANFKYSDKYSYSFDFTPLDDNGLKLIKQRPITHLLNAFENKLSDRAEEKRLLYVALTRCKEKLIISSSINKIKSGYSISSNSYLDIILKVLDIDLEEFMSTEKDHLLIEDSIIYELFGDRVGPEKHLIKVDLYDSILVNEDRKEVNEQALTGLKDHSKKLLDPIILENFTASKLNAFKNDKNEYYSKYFLGLPEFGDLELNGKIYNPQGFEDEILGTLKGTVFHAVMEEINEWYIESYDQELLDQNIIKQFEIENHLASQNEIEQIRQMVLNTLSEPFIKERINGLKRSKHELDLRMPFEDDYLFGSIDLLYEDEKGVEIWDWKTNKIPTNGVNELREKYTMQMKIYAYLVSKLYPEQNKIPAKLLLIELAGTSNDFMIEFEFDKNDLLEIENELKDHINTIKEMAF